jgi:hypothetical protein
MRAIAQRSHPSRCNNRKWRAVRDLPLTSLSRQFRFANGTCSLLQSSDLRLAMRGDKSVLSAYLPTRR